MSTAQKLRSLHLHVRECYFIAIRDGLKTDEYRLRNEYWEKRLLNPDGTWREYDEVVIWNAYKTGDANRITFAWRAPRTEEITHPHFGDNSVGVFAIPVRKEARRA